MKTKPPALLAAALLLLLAPAACTPDDPADDTRQTPVPEGYVDLGLPSGLLWADRNLGANTPEAYGNYYAWAETTPKNCYSWSNYRYGTYNKDITKYCTRQSYGRNGYTDGLTTLQAIDDPANIILGYGAHIPTRAEWQELLDNTHHRQTTQNDTVGYKFTAPNGNSIFLPAAGQYVSREVPCWRINRGSAYYWSSSLFGYDTPDHAYAFEGLGGQLVGITRSDGLPIRPVRPRN